VGFDRGVFCVEPLFRMGKSRRPRLTKASSRLKSIDENKVLAQLISFVFVKLETPL